MSKNTVKKKAGCRDCGDPTVIEFTISGEKPNSRETKIMTDKCRIWKCWSCTVLS